MRWPMLTHALRLTAFTLPICFGLTARQAPPTRLPFQVGERLTYDAKVNSFNAGKAYLSVEGLETVRGVGTFHAVFDVKGRVLFKKFANHYESWFDTTSLVTMRHLQKTDDVDKHYEFYPERKIYIKNNDGIENPSVSMPLDEASFLFYLRTVPLVVGKTLTVDRYYHAAKNPIQITVVRREHIKVPAGEFDAFVLKPVIKSNGLFSEKGDAEVWLADDPGHTLLKLRSRLPLGTLYLELRSAEFPN
jgi:hypothetical protein